MATPRQSQTASSPTGDASAQSVAPPRSSVGQWWWAAPIGLTVLCLAAYANSFSAGFALDSRQLILNDPRVHAVTRENLSAILQHTYWWPYGESGLYRPLTTVSFLVNYAVLGHGERPAGYHAFNLLVHVINVLLVWRLTSRVTSRAWLAVTTAALWAVLPLSTEAVTNIVGRADLMAATGMLGGLLLYLAARGPLTDDTQAEPGAPADATERPAALRVALCAGAALSFTAGVVAKESAIAALGIVVLIEGCWWSRGRSLRRLATMLAACVVPLTAWSLLRHSVLGAGGAAEFAFTDNPIVGATFWQGRLTALFVMIRYVALFVWPIRLSNDYSYPQIPLANGTFAEWAGVLLLGVGLLAAVWQMRANRAVVFWSGFAWLAFLPASNLLFATGTIMGERLLYLPSVGLVGLVAIALDWVASRFSVRGVSTAAALVLVAAYGSRTYARNADWTNDLTLWRSAVRNVPASAKAHRAFAEALYASDPTHANIDDVLAEAQASVDLLSALPDEQNSFQTFRQAGAYYLDKASTYRDGSEPAESAITRALYLRAQRNLDRAVVIARLGASQLPAGSVEPEADAQRLRAVALLALDNPDTALIAATRARALSPHHPLAYHLGASALIALHRDMEAAMLLLTGGIVSGDGALGQEVMALYTNGLDSDGCAVTGTGPGAALNMQCPIVRRHSCIASAAAYQIFSKTGEPVRARQVRESAVGTLGCPADLMDRSNSLVP